MDDPRARFANAKRLQLHLGGWEPREGWLIVNVEDRPGVIADVSAALRDQHVSLESMLQRGRRPDEMVPVVLTTHETEEAAMRQALARIEALDAVLEPPRIIRIEAL